MNKAQYIKYEEDNEEKDEAQTFKFLLRVSNLSQFMLAMFGAFIIITIEWSWIKVFFLTVLAGYLISNIMMIPFIIRYYKNKLKK